MPRIQWLRVLGGYSFAIFLYHVLFIDVAAHLCKQADFRSALSLGMVLLGVGLGGPVLLHYAVRGNRVLRSVMLGVR